MLQKSKFGFSSLKNKPRGKPRLIKRPGVSRDNLKMQQQDIYKGFRYSTKEVNATFKMWVYGIDESGNKIDTIVGVSGLIRIFGVDFANSFLDRAFNTVNKDKCVCKLRRGIKVTFYYY